MVKLSKAKAIFFCLIVFYPGCKETEGNREFEKTERSENRFFNFEIGGVPLRVEVAALPEERAKGLMFRDSMGLNEGMIFIFAEGTSQRFWMKNTRIPLDIGYISTTGILLEIHKAKPLDISGVPSRSNDIKFVLELNAGAYKKLGIPIGTRISLEDVSKLLVGCGLNPKDYNL